MTMYRREVDYPYEAASLISLLLSEEKLQAMQDLPASIARYPDIAGGLPGLLTALLDIIQAARPHVDLTNETTRLLFGETQGFSLPLWSALLYAPHTPQPGGDPFIQGMLALMDDPQEDDATHVDAQALQRRILALDRPYEVRAKLLMLCLGKDDFAAHVQAVIQPVRAVIQPMIQRLQPQIDEAMAPLSGAEDTAALEKVFETEGVPVATGDVTVRALYPHLFEPGALWALGDTVYAGVGIIAFTRISTAQRRDPARVTETLKIIADRSKFQILQILSQETLYAAEIAERTGLTAATISHHISQLTGYRLVQVIAKGGRTHYQTDKQVVQDTLDAARDLLRL